MIKSDKVILRALNKIDKGKILEWVNDPEIRELTGGIYPVSEIEHEKWFENRVLDPVNKIFAIQPIDSSNIIGIIGMKNVDFINRNAEIYIYIGDKQYWGNGYGSESVGKLVEFCFNELNMHRVYLQVFEYNERAIASYRKIGFETEGMMRESLYKNGKYHNKILMSIIKNKFGG
ncbi:GNAT family N-acetyltransferase [Terrisporobacter mayombei]|uniref:GNAT family N-acetyltransferase n=1 Tax=Terrisporobacter mayombei TaxID=1541 RepID=UPI0026580BBB|nr:GNAT family N-acetyltransferase [Terrisporobacter mayombei]